MKKFILMYIGAVDPTQDTMNGWNGSKYSEIELSILEIRLDRVKKSAKMKILAHGYRRNCWLYYHQCGRYRRSWRIGGQKLPNSNRCQNIQSITNVDNSSMKRYPILQALPLHSGGLKTVQKRFYYCRHDNYFLIHEAHYNIRIRQSPSVV